MNNTRALGLVAALVGAAGMGASGPFGPAVHLEPFCTCGQQGLPDAGTTRRGRCKRCHNRGGHEGGR